MIVRDFFNPKDTFECGQVFRYKKFDNTYQILSKGECAIVMPSDGGYQITSTNDAYFEHYFDLNSDYGEIVSYLKNYPNLTNAVEFGKGIRLLNQDIFETIISFLISQNNHIPRIKSIIENIAHAIGEKKQFENTTYYAFPTCNELAQQDENFFVKMGAGYRSKYLDVCSKILANMNLQELASLDDVELKKQLLSFKGIGEKVCDCIMLFAFKRTTSFPVDTWIAKVFSCGEDKDLTRLQLAKKYSSIYGKYAGYVQQYLFYYQRENSSKIRLNLLGDIL